MALIPLRSSCPGVQGVAFADVVPDRVRPCNPVVVADIRVDSDLILTRLAEHQDIIRQPRSKPARILFELGEQQALAVGADSLGLGILIHRDIPVVVEATPDEMVNHSKSLLFAQLKKDSSW